MIRFEETNRWNVVADDGSRYVVIELTRFNGRVSGGVMQWVAGSREFKLDTGEHVSQLPHGAFEIVMTGERLTVVHENAQ